MLKQEWICGEQRPLHVHGHLLGGESISLVRRQQLILRYAFWRKFVHERCCQVLFAGVL
jgi:hypothetical protein